MYILYMNKEGIVKEVNSFYSSYCFISHSYVEAISVNYGYNEKSKRFDKEYGIVLKRFYIKDNILEEYLDWFRDAFIIDAESDEDTSTFLLLKKTLNVLLEAGKLEDFIKDNYSSALRYHPLEQTSMLEEEAKKLLYLLPNENK